MASNGFVQPLLAHRPTVRRLYVCYNLSSNTCFYVLCWLYRRISFFAYHKIILSQELPSIMNKNHMYHLINNFKFYISGLDPARPLVTNYGSSLFRLGRDDAYVVHVIHTNAGFLGETGLVGHADFCVNGGRLQPGCKGHMMRKMRSC